MDWKKIRKYLNCALIFIILATLFIVLMIIIGVTATAALMQAVFAGILLLFVYRQTKIIKKQAEISEKVHEFNQIMVMQNDHDSLSDPLRLFWSSLALLYKCFKNTPPLPESFPENFSGIINFYGIIDIKKIKKDLFLPKFDITKIETVDSLLKQHESDWDQSLVIWKLAKFFYSEGVGVGKIYEDSDNGEQIFQTQRNTLWRTHYDLADFWNQRYFLLDKIYMKPYLYELTMLIWLELALIKYGKDSMLGKEAFFTIVKSVWQFLDDMTHNSTL